MRAARASGMTLIEIMIVVAIIGMIVGGVGVVAFRQFGKAQIKTAEREVAALQGAVETFMTQNSSNCPGGLQDLYAQKIITKEPKDPWGQPYQYRCPGEKNTDSVDIWSGGPDKKLGTGDDIKNW